MPDRVDVALAILTLVLAVVAVIGRLLLGLLEWGERLLLALRGRRPLVHEMQREHVHVPDPPDPFRRAATARDRVERRPCQKEARAYARARLRDLVFSAGQELGAPRALLAPRPIQSFARADSRPGGGECGSDEQVDQP